VRIVDEASWNLIEVGLFEQLPQKMLFDLVEIELIVPAIEDELATIINGQLKLLEVPSRRMPKFRRISHMGREMSAYCHRKLLQRSRNTVEL
jgi:hypothetical protein